MAINVQNVERFRFIAHKIIPLVYDDSLSYYEFLCKVMQKLNEVISSLDNQNGILETFDNEILDWETRTDSKYNDYVNNMDALFDAFKQSEVTARTAFMNALIGNYNASTHYTVGQYVAYKNNVYKCTTATSGEEWNPAHWTQVVYADDLSKRESDFESSMQTQWNAFFKEYLHALGVVQSTGDSTEFVMSQKAVTDELNGIKGDLENYTKNIGLYGESSNIVDLTKLTNGYYIKPDGSVNTNELYSYTDFIPVTEGDVIVSWKWLGSKWVKNNESIRFIAAYDSNNNVIAGSGTEKQFEYVVPSGVSYIILSCRTNSLENKTQMILRNYTQTPSEYIEYVQGEYKGKASFISPDMASEIEDISIGKTQSIKRCRGGFIASGNLSEDIVFPNNSVNARYRIVVKAKITTLGTITIGRKNGSTSYGYFEIDGSEIRWYSTGTTLTKAYNHGLTIDKECTIIIETNPSPTSAYKQYEHRVIVVSGGQSYTTENIVIQNFSKGKTCYIHADNSTLSVDVSFTFYNAKSPVYAFGDSYFTWGPKRWTGYLYDDGFANNVLTDAYSGRGSKDALESLKNLEYVGIPSYILWCMGMNDADTAESVNSNWQTAYDYVCNYCDNHHIELILATIPEVTNNSYRNDKKNSIVKNSGRRYVDFAKAVNAETVGSSWYDGMLASDGVHPTESGARTLYNQILVDFPEIMLFN